MPDKSELEAVPYFDMLLEKLRAGSPGFSAAFGRHVHWGYWDDPATADTSAEDLGRAAETMCMQISAAARIADGMSVLDVGCGFGGTIGNLNSRFSKMELVGLNIDERQIARAESLVTARPGNVVRFVKGEASKLPFADATFDVVLAVESIFHFPDRVAFLKEARRVAKPSGTIVVSDIVAQGYLLPLMALKNLKPGTYGRISAVSPALYRIQAYRAGLRIVNDRDITKNVLPTYGALYRLRAPEDDGPEAKKMERETRGHEWFMKKRQVTYRILELQQRPKR